MAEIWISLIDTRNDEFFNVKWIVSEPEGYPLRLRRI
jgi:hypothetical protein